jgi:hypothetical protein
MVRRNNNRRRFPSMRGYTPILKEVSKDILIAANSTTGGSVDLLTVPADSQTSMTVRSFTTDLYIEMVTGQVSASLEKAQFYVMFLPEGHNVTPNLPFQHPEWILSYTYQGTPSSDTETIGYNIRRRSKKVRKLKPGDSIFLFASAENSTSGTWNINVSGLIKYFVKMN